MEKTLKLAPGEAHLGPATPGPSSTSHLLPSCPPPARRRVAAVAMDAAGPSPPSPAPCDHGRDKNGAPDPLDTPVPPFPSSSSRHRRGEIFPSAAVAITVAARGQRPLPPTPPCPSTSSSSSSSSRRRNRTVEPGSDDYAVVPLRRRSDIAVKFRRPRALPEPTLNGYAPTVSPFIVAVFPLALPVA